MKKQWIVWLSVLILIITCFTAVSAQDDTWTCENGHSGNTGRFCTECGAPKPEPVDDGTWTCENGHGGNTGRFCTECGAPRPVTPEIAPTPEDGPEVITIPLTFERGTEDEQVAQINGILAGMLLSDMELEDINDYLATTTTRDAEGNITAKKFRLGFDSLTLVCTLDENEDLYTFLIDTAVYPRSDGMDTDMFKEAWLEKNPGNVMRTIWHIAYDSSEADAFIAIYHAADSEEPQEPDPVPTEVPETPVPTEAPDTPEPSGDGAGGFADFFANRGK